MPEVHRSFGVPVERQDPGQLRVKMAQQTWAVLQHHPDFTPLEIRILEDSDGRSEILVAKCHCQGVWSKNRVGIRTRETLALRFYDGKPRLPEVRVLRDDFPTLLHTNDVRDGEPVSLCLYYEPWSAVQRDWTPQRFLARIQEWLTESANESLHPADQLPEQLFFESPVAVVLPSDFDQLRDRADLTLGLLGHDVDENVRLVAQAYFHPLAENAAHPARRNFFCIALSLPSVPHAPIARPPKTLGALHDELARRGADLETPLFAELRRLVHERGWPGGPSYVLLILTIPVHNPAGGAPRVERRGILIKTDLGTLGERAGVLRREPGAARFFAVTVLGTHALDPAWRETDIEPFEVLEPFTPKAARLFSGIVREGPEGILAGVGALGSAIAERWIREGWGTWTYVDNDVLMPHNLARHRGIAFHIGLPKAQMVQRLAKDIIGKEDRSVAVDHSILDWEKEGVTRALERARLIVDVTTTLDAPRVLAGRDDVARSVSLFITPSGTDSVLLMEDVNRSIRLDALEAQYYRLILNSTWGADHLRGHRGKFWVGAGCRDISAVIPEDLIALHAGILARQTRQLSNQDGAVIQVWRCNPETCAVETIAMGVSQPLVSKLGETKVVWDEGLLAKVRLLREDGLPAETGGVLLGFVDHSRNVVHVVDALPAPPDSIRTSTSFGRGVEGLEAAINTAAARTANIVRYIGEWHSHPRYSSSEHSMLDLMLLAHMAEIQIQDGDPALMLIMGEEDYEWLLV